jgi:hypothetical protein
MYRREEFKEWFAAKPVKSNTVSAHVWMLNKIDDAFDLDGKLAQFGIDGILAWAKQETTGPFEKYPSNARTALNRFIEFTVASQSPEEPLDELEADEATAPILFKLEKEMQAAVRRQLSQLEQGLKVDDGGIEISVTTGKIDIVARDAQNRLVVIELKVGKCPSGAMEQALGYAEALSEEREEPVRAYLIAGAFSDRILAAARRATDLKLRTYEFSVTFNPVPEEKG